MARRRGFGAIRKLPSRRWQASYVGPDTIRHAAPVTFETAEDAEGWLTDRRREIKNEDWTPPTSRQPVTFEEHAERWLMNRTLKPRTRYHYRKIFEKDDANHDPLLEFDFEAGVLRRHVPNNKAAEAIGPDVTAGDLISEEPLGESRYADVSPELIASLRSLTASAFEVIEDAWKQQGGVYIDFKIECGFDRETGDLLVADVIDSDSGRLRFGGRHVQAVVSRRHGHVAGDQEEARRGCSPYGLLRRLNHQNIDTRGSTTRTSTSPRRPRLPPRGQRTRLRLPRRNPLTLLNRTLMPAVRTHWGHDRQRG